MGHTRGRLYSFSGVDGSGKSTQIKLLIQHLEHEGRSPIYLWVRGGYTPLLNRAKSELRIAFQGHVLPKAGKSDQRSQLFRRRYIRRTWLTLSIVEMIWLYVVKTRFWLWQGRDVVCDRHVVDTLLDFRINFPEEHVDRWRLSRLLMYTLAEPSVKFLMLVPVELTSSRSTKKQEPFPDHPNVTEYRLHYYQELGKSGHWVLLDGSLPAETIATQIWLHICELGYTAH